MTFSHREQLVANSPRSITGAAFIDASTTSAPSGDPAYRSSQVVFRALSCDRRRCQRRAPSAAGEEDPCACDPKRESDTCAREPAGVNTSWK